MTHRMLQTHAYTVADPGFSMGGVWTHWGRGSAVRALFGENVCENERIGSRRGACAGTPPRSANGYCENTKTVVWKKFEKSIDLV